MNPLDLLLDPLQYDFVLRALGAATVAAAVCALLSCWLVLIGWSLMGDAVSHAVLPGVVVASIVGLPFAVGALIAGFVAVGAIGVIRDRSRVKEDAAMGIVFTTMFASGLVLISVIPSQTDLQHIIFGDVLGVSNADLLQIGLLSAAVAVTVIVKRRDLTLYAFDAQHAFAIGLSPGRLRALLLAVLAATAVVALQVAGVILVVAMLVIPGATARLLTDRFGRMLVIAPIIAAAAAVVGIYLSFWWDTASGPLVVVVQGAVFAVVWLVSPLRRTGSTGRPRRRAAIVGA
ncbi:MULTISPECIES: metal ABC transporter permease [unclassified Salinibacterium]|uniref:metal ABC transporter permease n=1 Tax=unclassified Salinibacterium TaxID=2632331 RepID=UPI001424225B|nr:MULTISPECIES: metal ABC transporter permease [unclassified Salinibacterium]